MASLWTGQWQGGWEGRLIGPIDPNFITGVASLQLAASGVTTGAGILSGSSFFALSAVGEIENGVSAAYASGTAGFGLGAAATLSGIGSITGTGEVSLNASATLVGALLASGQAQIVFNASGDAYLAVNAGGESTVTLGASASLTALGRVLGTGEVLVSGSASLTAIGHLDGASGITLLSDGRIFSPLWTSGVTGVSVGITGDINGAAWAQGSAAVDLDMQGAITAIGSIAGAASVVLRTRYFDLNRYEKSYVLAALSSVYTSTEVEQIVSIASQNNLCVRDAIETSYVSTSPITAFVQTQRKVGSTSHPMPKPVQQKLKPKSLPVYVLGTIEQVFTQESAQQIYATVESNNLTIRSAMNQVVVTAMRETKELGQ